MPDADARALGRAALLLLAASVVRVALVPRAAAPPPGEDVLEELLQDTRERTQEADRRAAPLRPGERVDANRAPAEEVDRLPGVGPSTARAWVEARDTLGGFRSPEDLLAIRGVGPALVARIRDHVDFSGPAPAGRRPASRTARVLTGRAEPGGGAPGGGAPGGSGVARLDVNRADTLALQALPGVGPALARRIVEARREAPFKAVADLVRVRGIGPATLERLRPLVTVGR